MDKEWYTIRYRYDNNHEWSYHKMNGGSFKLWSKGHIDRIYRDYYDNGRTANAEIVSVVIA